MTPIDEATVMTGARRARIAASLVFGLAMVASMTAQAGDLRLSTYSAGERQTDRSFDAVAEERVMTRGGIRLAYEVVPNLYLGAEFIGGATSDTLFGDIDTQLTVRQGGLRLAYRQPVHPWVELFGTVGAAAGRATMELTPASGTSGDYLSDEAPAFTLDGNAGVTWFFGDMIADLVGDGWDSFRLGFEARAGYAYTLDIAFDEGESRIEGDPAAVDLGTLSLRGARWGTGLVLGWRF